MYNNDDDIIKIIIESIWEGFKTLLTYFFIIHVILFFLLGGEFHLKIRWENLDYLITYITSSK